MGRFFYICPMDKSKNPIGLFDSGIGGTSIWKEIHRLLPHEDSIYLADSKNAPYGQRPKQEIIDLSIKNTEFLLDQGAKIIVVACNTATTNAITELREKYKNINFIGIEPAIKPAAIHTQTGAIGILATKGTLSSELFTKTVSGFKNINVVEQVGYNLVALIENGMINSPEIKELLKEHLQPMIEARIDHLVLGCSHYPYLIPQIQEILPKDVKIIDSGEAVARQTKKVLLSAGLLNPSLDNSHQVFYTNSDPQVLNSILENKYTVEQKDF